VNQPLLPVQRADLKRERAGGTFLDFRIRQLQCFLVLSDYLNYGMTARALYISQPTLTFQIKGLEEVFGVRLFDRNRQHVRLTDAGVAFREYAKAILDTVDAAKECLSDLHARMRLRVSCGPVGQFILLPAVIRTLSSEYPEFELEVTELTTEQQLSQLPEGKVDALLMVSSLPIPGMRFDPLCKESLVAMVSRHSPLARQSSISVQAMREHSVIAAKLKDCRFHQPFLHHLLAPFGITPRIVEAPYSCAVQFAYAAAGEGIAITTASMAACTFPNVVALPFEEELPELQLGLASIQANESLALQIFRQVVLRNVKAHLQARNMTWPAMRHRPVVVPSRKTKVAFGTVSKTA
jgi:DNA-binding transcriptional LysR family regulator